MRRMLNLATKIIRKLKYVDTNWQLLPERENRYGVERILCLLSMLNLGVIYYEIQDKS